MVLQTDSNKDKAGHHLKGAPKPQNFNMAEIFSDDPGDNLRQLVSSIREEKGDREMFSVYLEYAKRKLHDLGMEDFHPSTVLVSAVCCSLYAHKRLEITTHDHCRIVCEQFTSASLEKLVSSVFHLQTNPPEDISCNQICNFFEQQEMWISWILRMKSLDQIIPIVLERFNTAQGIC